MQLVIQGRNVEITAKIREYIEKRMARLDRQLDDTAEVRVELSHEHTRSQQDGYSAQVTTRRNGAILRAETNEADLFASIDDVVDKMDRQIGRYKGKRRKAYMQKDAALKAVIGSAAEEEIEVEEESPPEEQAIVRTKRFAMNPMDPQEAIEQMELLGHDFFVFFNPATSSVNVVYRRREGDYGLLQPEMA